MIALAFVALMPADLSWLVDFNATQRIALAHNVVDAPDPDKVGPDPCKLEELGGKAESYDVIGEQGVVTTFDIASFETKPCATKASAAKARAEADKALAAMGLHTGRKGLKATKIGKDGAIRSEWTTIDKEEPFAVFEQRIVAGNITIQETHAEFSRMAGGHVDIVPILIEESGKKFILEDVARSDNRSSQETFRVIGPLVLPANGVDVDGLAAITFGEKCVPSIASNQALVENVAATIAWTVGVPATVTAAQKERATSIVYASDACTEPAKALAAKLPGGATVEKLTWKTASGIVVALGSSATPK